MATFRAVDLSGYIANIPTKQRIALGAIQRVVLSGGCSLLSDLSSYLSTALELPVEIANPFRGIIADPKKFDPEYLSSIAPQMAVAVGLALRERGDDVT